MRALRTTRHLLVHWCRDPLQPLAPISSPHVPSQHHSARGCAAAQPAGQAGRDSMIVGLGQVAPHPTPLRSAHRTQAGRQANLNPLLKPHKVTQRHSFFFSPPRATWLLAGNSLGLSQT